MISGIIIITVIVPGSPDSSISCRLARMLMLMLLQENYIVMEADCIVKNLSKVKKPLDPRLCFCPGNAERAAEIMQILREWKKTNLVLLRERKGFHGRISQKRSFATLQSIGKGQTGLFWVRVIKVLPVLNEFVEVLPGEVLQSLRSPRSLGGPTSSCKRPPLCHLPSESFYIILPVFSF